MNKIIFYFCLLFFTAALAFAADTDKIITLKDGSHIKGQMTGIANGVYTIKTPIIGDIHIDANDIASISNEKTAPQAPSGSTFENQIASQQRQIMANPQAMADIQTLTQDPEIMKALGDPALVQAVASHDYQAIQNNPKMQELMNNPKMQALMQKIASSQQQQRDASSQ